MNFLLDNNKSKYKEKNKKIDFKWISFNKIKPKYPILWAKQKLRVWKIFSSRLKFRNWWMIENLFKISSISKETTNKSDVIWKNNYKNNKSKIKVENLTNTIL